MFRIICVLILSSASIEAYKHYQSRFPNGDNVPHPCKPNYLWKGVGHKNINGGGERNPFGRDFAANGHKWDACICKRDSDGDGKTNGEELGDPDCVWTEGATPANVKGITHPGVCEPLDSPACVGRNDWSFCEYETFECEATKEADVTEVVLQFPNTTVPAEETTYWCMTFNLPNDTDYHLIASEPLIDNENIMHHIVLSGCDEEPKEDTSWWINEPRECGMSEARCRNIIALWTVGLAGNCEPKEYGYRVGKSGIKAVNMQFHWNNPEKKSDYTDMSGMKLYLTKKIRPNDAAILSTGSLYLNIPPGLSSSSHIGHCSSGCTSWLPHPIHFPELLFHMHYLGHSASLEHIRGNSILQLITEPSYSYDNPTKTKFDPPIEFLPGDELRLTCNFKSKTRSQVTYYGDGTSDEMCLAFLTFYPATGFSTCTSYKSLEVCERRVGGSVALHPMKDCQYPSFYWKLQAMVMNVSKACSGTAEKCSASCNRTISYYRQTEPCLQGDVGHFTETNILAKNNAKEFVGLLHACDEEWDRTIIFKDEKPNWTIDKGITSTTKEPPSGGACVFDQDEGKPDTGAASVLTNVCVTMWAALILQTILY